MPDRMRALVFFTQAALGENENMQWSMSEDILRRQIKPIFERCAQGELTAEESLDTAIDFSKVRFANNLDVLLEEFKDLSDKVGKYGYESFISLQGLLMGLDEESEWVTDEQIMRQEMYYIFVRTSVGKLSPKAACTIFCDHVVTKQKYYLDRIQGLIRELSYEMDETAAQELEQLTKSDEAEPDQESPES